MKETPSSESNSERPSDDSGSDKDEALEASDNERYQLRQVAPQVLTIATFRLDDNIEYVPVFGEAMVAPGGTIALYTSGPEGKSVTITLEKLRSQDGHDHSGGPTGTISPDKFINY